MIEQYVKKDGKIYLQEIVEKEVKLEDLEDEKKKIQERVDVEIEIIRERAIRDINEIQEKIDLIKAVK